MNVVFAGTPAFAAEALDAIARAGHHISLVLTQPDRPAGRGMKLQASEVKQWALAHGVPVAQPQGLRLDGRFADEATAAQALLSQQAMDVMVVAAYGLILPQWVLDMPRWGCLNIHASLLPRWRGAAPIHRAIEAGDRETGVTIMQMDAGLDTGDMLRVDRLAIDPQDTTAGLHDKLAKLGGEAIVAALADLATTGLPATPQPVEGVNYAHKIEKVESWLDWQLSAEELARRVRAFNPFPAAAMRVGDDGEVVKVWAAEALPGGLDAEPGAIVAVSEQGVDVACAQGVLRCTELQRAGARRLPVADFLRGKPWNASHAWSRAQCTAPTGGAPA